MYGKATETAIGSMSRLAEVWDEPQRKLSATQIAATRKLQAPFVAKVLSTLSRAGLVVGSRGPGGGFRLAKPPSEIPLFEVFRLFEREATLHQCPFGGGICGVDEPCPLHDRLATVNKAVDHVLHDTTFEVFRARYREKQADQKV